MKTVNEKITGSSSDRLAEAGRNLMDVARSIVAEHATPDQPLDTREQAAISLAVQAITLGDDMTERPISGDFLMKDLSVFETRFFGLGLGVGNLIGAIADGIGQDAAAVSFEDGAERGMRNRAPNTARSFAKHRPDLKTKR